MRYPGARGRGRVDRPLCATRARRHHPPRGPRRCRTRRCGGDLPNRRRPGDRCHGLWHRDDRPRRCRRRAWEPLGVARQARRPWIGRHAGCICRTFRGRGDRGRDGAGRLRGDRPRSSGRTRPRWACVAHHVVRAGIESGHRGRRPARRVVAPPGRDRGHARRRRLCGVSRRSTTGAFCVERHRARASRVVLREPAGTRTARTQRRRGVPWPVRSRVARRLPGRTEPHPANV